MKFFMISFFLILSSLAGAQERKFTVTITESEAPIVGRALAKMPYEDVARIIDSLNRQINSQIMAEKEAADKVKEQSK